MEEVLEQTLFGTQQGNINRGLPHRFLVVKEMSFRWLAVDDFGSPLQRRHVILVLSIEEIKKSGFGARGIIGMFNGTGHQRIMAG